MVTTTIAKSHTKAKPKWYKKHRFAPALKRQIKQLHQLDNWHGLLQVTEDWGWIASAVTASVWSWQHLPLILGASVYGVAVLIIGARQRGLRVNNHQATHKGLAKNKHLNFFLAAPLGSWLVLESFTGYDDTHNSKANGHHFNLGTAKDVDHLAVVNQGLYEAGHTPEMVTRYLLTLPLKTPNYILFLLKNRVWNPQENTLERVIRLLYFVSITACFVSLGWGGYFCAYWLVPLLTTANWLGAVIQLAEHYPLMETAEPLDLYLSRNRLLSPVINIFLGTHGEGYHLIHHLFPSLPLWQMKKAHGILMEDETYAAVHEDTGLSGLVKQLLG